MREGRKAYGYNLVFPSPWVVEVVDRPGFEQDLSSRSGSVRTRLP